MQRISQNVLMGLGISSTIYLVMGVLFTSGEVRRNSLLIIGMGIAIGGLSSIYNSQRISLLTKTSCQLLGSYAVFLGAAYWGNWFPFQLGIIVTASCLFVSLFLGIWTCFYLKEKNELAKINQKLTKL